MLAFILKMSECGRGFFCLFTGVGSEDGDASGEHDGRLKRLAVPLHRYGWGRKSSAVERSYIDREISKVHGIINRK